MSILNQLAEVSTRVCPFVPMKTDPAQRLDNLHPEQHFILQLIDSGRTYFWQIRRALHVATGCETRASETGRMLDALVKAGYVEAARGCLRLTALGRDAARE